MSEVPLSRDPKVRQRSLVEARVELGGELCLEARDGLEQRLWVGVQGLGLRSKV